MKGINPLSGDKHDMLTRLAAGQVARIKISSFRPNRAVVIDMHAGDGEGARARQPDLFLGDESKATPVIAAQMSIALRKAGISTDLILCERNAESHARLEPFALRHRAELIRNHDRLPDLSAYHWALIFNDPNGPSDHGDSTLGRISTEVRRADFLIVVNEAGIIRPLGAARAAIECPRTNPKAFGYSRDPAEAAKIIERYGWRLDPTEWARRLNRRFALHANQTYGTGAMKGRVLLLTNSPQTTPRGFTLATAERQPARPAA